jgi:hypothetical protein
MAMLIAVAVGKSSFEMTPQKSRCHTSNDDGTAIGAVLCIQSPNAGLF